MTAKMTDEMKNDAAEKATDKRMEELQARMKDRDRGNPADDLGEAMVLIAGCMERFDDGSCANRNGGKLDVVLDILSEIVREQIFWDETFQVDIDEENRLVKETILKYLEAHGKTQPNDLAEAVLEVGEFNFDPEVNELAKELVEAGQVVLTLEGGVPFLGLAS